MKGIVSDFIAAILFFILWIQKDSTIFLIASIAMAFCGVYNLIRMKNAEK